LGPGAVTGPGSLPGNIGTQPIASRMSQHQRCPMRYVSRSVSPVLWWSAFLRRARQSGPQRPRPIPLPLEQLEDRITLSGLTALVSFNGTNGACPYAAVIMDSSGNLYGTTEGGGPAQVGTVFELAKGSGAITALASFNGTNGAYPYAGVIMDSTGNLYG